MVGLAFDGPSPRHGRGLDPLESRIARVKAVALFALGGRPDIWGHTNLLLLDPGGHIQGAYGFAEALARVFPGTVARASNVSR